VPAEGKLPEKSSFQTSNPDHPLLAFIVSHGYEDFYHKELKDRQQNGYPPFSRLIEITVKHSDKKICRDAAQELTLAFRDKLTGIKVLGPAEPMISKLRNQFLMATLIKIPRGQGDLTQIKNTIISEINELLKQKEFRSVRVVVDVDPV
jgi:primosomal protein N' (replication factor Y) (superfamily II helicase)